MALGSDRVLLSNDGQVAQTLRTDFSKRRLAWYPLSSFPPSVRQSVILAEDKRFPYHLGFDPIGFGRALVALIKGGSVQGASTITMQLSDLIQEDVLLHNRRIRKGSVVHKALQTARAVFIELRWTKDEILEAYLNLIHLRGEYQGVPAVTHAYLNKHPLALDSAEAVVIAAMIASPNQGPKTLKRKACHLLHRLTVNSGNCEGTNAAADLFFRRPFIAASPGVAPHLARRMFRENQQDSILESSLDRELQERVLGILDKNIHRLKEANVQDSAAIVIDNKTGKVLAYVGAVSSSKSPHVDGVQAARQAGSTLKPFLYAKAFEQQTLTPASILMDDATAISWGGDVYRPANYDKHFYGPVSVREALGSSLNVPAVKTVTIIGLHQTYQVLQSIGITGMKEPDFYGVSMALGAVEVKLEDLANAYRMLANGGEWTPLRFTAEDHVSHGRQVFPKEAAFQIASILSDPDARAIGFGWDNPLETPFWTAVKTGTSKDYRDNWCVGYSEKYTVAVWAGNFDAQAMHKVSGVSGAGPSWYEIMTYLHRQERSLAPKPPENVIAKRIRHQWSSSERTEYFIKGTEPEETVIEPAPEKRVQFVFPAEGSILVKDPQLDPERIALYVRFKGHVPEQSRIVWNETILGEAMSPFKVDHPAPGRHKLAIVSPDGKVLNSIQFTIRGTN